MTVAELIEKLSELDPGLSVLVYDGMGDINEANEVNSIDYGEGVIEVEILPLYTLKR